MEIIKPGTQIPFLSYRRWGFVLSSVLVVGVLLLLSTKVRISESTSKAAPWCT